MEIGIDSFVAAVPDTLTGENLRPAGRLSYLLEEIHIRLVLVIVTKRCYRRGPGKS